MQVQLLPNILKAALKSHLGLVSSHLVQKACSCHSNEQRQQWCFDFAVEARSNGVPDVVPDFEKGSMSICWGPKVHQRRLVVPSFISTSMKGASGLRVRMS